MASPFEPSRSQVTLEAEVAVFDAELASMGASDEVRAELAGRFRAIAPLTGEARAWAVLALADDVMPIIEEWLLAIGHDEQAVGRSP